MVLIHSPYPTQATVKVDVLKTALSVAVNAKKIKFKTGCDQSF